MLWGRSRLGLSDSTQQDAWCGPCQPPGVGTHSWEPVLFLISYTLCSSLGFMLDRGQPVRCDLTDESISSQVSTNNQYSCSPAEEKLSN